MNVSADVLLKAFSEQMNGLKCYATFFHLFFSVAKFKLWSDITLMTDVLSKCPWNNKSVH